MAMHIAFGNIGSILNSYNYRALDAPQFFSGHGSLVGPQCMSLTLSILTTLYLPRDNKRCDAEFKAAAIHTEDETAMKMEKGDVLLSSAVWFEMDSSFGETAVAR